MKKLVCLLLAALMLAGIAVPVWAEEPIPLGGSEPGEEIVLEDETSPVEAPPQEAVAPLDTAQDATPPSGDATYLTGEEANAPPSDVYYDADADSEVVFPEIIDGEPPIFGAAAEDGPVIEVQDAGNDNYNTATNIKVNTTYSARSLSDSDNDWYKFTLPSRGYISITFTNDFKDTSSSAWCVDFFKGTSAGISNRWYSWYFSPYVKTRTTLPEGLSPATYYVCVDPYGQGAKLNYTLRINYTAATNWEVEPNGNYNSSNQIPTNQTIYASSMNAEDYDWFRFTLETDGVVNIKFNNDYSSSSSTGWALDIYRATSGSHTDSLLRSAFRPDATEHSTGSLNLSAGTHYIRVDPYSAGADLKYNLTVQYTLRPQWVYRDGYWYYRKSDGYDAIGWMYQGGSWYYLDPASGAMRTGWMYLDGYWYLLNPDGAMATGWSNSGGAWYYLRPTGTMVTGWLNLGGAWYYLDGSGVMLTGWQYLGGIWYHFDPSGVMATGWRTIGGVRYYFNSSGQWVA